MVLAGSFPTHHYEMRRFREDVIIRRSQVLLERLFPDPQKASLLIEWKDVCPVINHGQLHVRYAIVLQCNILNLLDDESAETASLDLRGYCDGPSLTYYFPIFFSLNHSADARDDLPIRPPLSCH